MELQIPYRIRTEISAESVLPREESGDRENIATVMRMEGSQDNRSGSVPGTHTSICRDSAKNIGVGIYGIFKGKERSNDV